jgi:hypothetical protein
LDLVGYLVVLTIFLFKTYFYSKSAEFCSGAFPPKFDDFFVQICLGKFKPFFSGKIDQLLGEIKTHGPTTNCKNVNLVAHCTFSIDSNITIKLQGRRKIIVFYSLRPHYGVTTINNPKNIEWPSTMCNISIAMAFTDDFWLQTKMVLKYLKGLFEISPTIGTIDF